MVCGPACIKFLGAVMYVLGFLVAGIMFIMVGVEYDETTPDLSNIHYYVWIYAWAMMAAAIGIIFEAEQVFCGDDTNRNLGYFAELFELVGVFGMGALGFGLAVYFSDAKNEDSAAQLLSASTRKALSSMIAVASLLYLLGALLVIVDLCRQGKACCMAALLRYFNIVMSILLSVFWFFFADVMVSTTSTANDRSGEYSLAIGILLLTTGVGGFLKCALARSDMNNKA